MRNSLCPNCGSQEVIPNVEVRDYDASSYRPLSLTVQLPRPQGGFIAKSTESSEVRATVCGGCGYTEFFATKHRELLAAYRTA